jgi:hypothetical protein
MLWNRFRKQVTITLVFLSFLSVWSVMAQQNPSIIESELKAPAVNFQNRSGRFASNARMTIDNELGEKFAANIINSKSFENEHFRIKRILNPESPGYGSDIIEILPAANIGHINAIQRILSSYLSKAYQYNEKDAATLSRFVLYYNAFHRGRTEVVKEKYQEEVLKNIVPEKMGIDISYKNWPGKTMLILPLKASIIRPGGTDLDHSEVDRGSGAVTKDEKKEIEDLRNRRKTDDLQKLDQKNDELKKQEAKLKKELEDSKKKEEQIKKDTANIKKQQEDTTKPFTPWVVQEVKKQEVNLTNQQQQSTETQAKIDEVKKNQDKVQKQKDDTKKDTASSPGKTSSSPAATAPPTAAKPEEIKKAEAAVQAAKQETQEVKKQNEDLTKKVEDMQSIAQNTIGEKILFLRVVRNSSTGHFNNELWAIESNSNDALMRSPFSNICSRDFQVVPGQGGLVAGYDGSFDREDEHRMYMLDPEKLTVKYKSENRIFWDTPFVLLDNKIYVIEMLKGEYFLSRFSPDLKLEARSSKPVHSHSDITFHKDKIYITGKPKTGDATPIMVIKKDSLEHIKTIEPDSLPVPK